MITDFERELRKNALPLGIVGSEYVVRVQHDLGDEGIVFYIRPSDRDGSTVDFIIKGNDLETKDGIDLPTHQSLYNTNVRLSNQLINLQKEYDFYKGKMDEITKIISTITQKHTTTQ